MTLFGSRIIRELFIWHMSGHEKSLLTPFYWILWVILTFLCPFSTGSHLSSTICWTQTLWNPFVRAIKKFSVIFCTTFIFWIYFVHIFPLCKTNYLLKAFSLRNKKSRSVDPFTCPLINFPNRRHLAIFLTFIAVATIFNSIICLQNLTLQFSRM